MGCTVSFRRCRQSESVVRKPDVRGKELTKVQVGEAVGGSGCREKEAEGAKEGDIGHETLVEDGL